MDEEGSSCVDRQEDRSEGGEVDEKEEGSREELFTRNHSSDEDY